MILQIAAMNQQDVESWFCGTVSGHHSYDGIERFSRLCSRLLGGTQGHTKTDVIEAAGRGDFVTFR